MSRALDICGAVVADTAYCDGKLVARDCAITLPEITPVSVDLTAMGPMSLPVWQIIESMEASLTKVGIDLGLRSLIKPDMKPLEFRWAQSVTTAAGGTKTVGCKAFITGIPNKLPGISLEVGSATESEVTFAVTRYALFVDGEEYHLIDKLAGICRIAGTDYMQSVNALL